MRQSILRSVVALTLLFCCPSLSFSYSVLTHEAIIDSVWGDSIQPLIIRRFPKATAEQLREAYAHAYGGALIQDMGYYPFGSKLFTDLTHYVRSGDFIKALLTESQDINEYAFALGALSHYAADSEGHSMAVNRVVPALYPKLRAKHGDEVTYDENPTAHMRTEFGFDVLQVARGRYAPTDYRNFIGFKVSKHALERAFKATYALELKDVFSDLDLAIGSFRRAASAIIPKMTQVAWETKKDEIETSRRAPREKSISTTSREPIMKRNGGRSMTSLILRTSCWPSFSALFRASDRLRHSPSNRSRRKPSGCAKPASRRRSTSTAPCFGGPNQDGLFW